MKDDKGEMIIEASIVFPLVLIIYGILMFLVLLMYQKITLTTVANNTVKAVFLQTIGFLIKTHL